MTRSKKVSTVPGNCARGKDKKTPGNPSLFEIRYFVFLDQKKTKKSSETRI